MWQRPDQVRASCRCAYSFVKIQNGEIRRGYVFASLLSERHAAYAAGLGTFGLCDGLITPKGKAMRCGSVVARIQIAATPRPYEDHHAYCLFYAKGNLRHVHKHAARQAPSPNPAMTRLACMKQLWRHCAIFRKTIRIKGIWVRILPDRNSLRIANTSLTVA